jgi:hypothetical protein
MICITIPVLVMYGVYDRSCGTACSLLHLESGFSHLTRRKTRVIQ